MATTSLIASISSLALIGKNYLTSFKNKIGDLVLDASDSEIIEHSTTITNHPVSSGANISDHIYNNPIIIKIDGMITNESLYLSDINTLPGFFQGNVLTNIYKYITGPSQKQILAFNFLETLKENKTLVTIVTRMKSYENMAIESLNFSRDKFTGDRLMFSIILKQINIVSNKIINITKPVLPSSKVGASNLASLGRGNIQEVIPQKKQETKTRLKQDIDKITNIFK
jgi:hypothetical protein